MQKKVILGIMFLLILGGIFLFNRENNQERACCKECLQYDAETTEPCLDVVIRNEGTKHCSLIFGEEPHSIAQCEERLTKGQ